MPLYDYKNNESGELVTFNVPIDERDNQEGFTRIISFKGMTSTTFGGLK